MFTWGRADVGQLGLPESYLEIDDMGKVCTFPKAVPDFNNNSNISSAYGKKAR